MTLRLAAGDCFACNAEAGGLGLGALEEPLRGDFEADYRRRIKAAYPAQPDGHTLLPFRRLFMVAEK